MFTGTVTGNLGKDAEVRTAGDTPVCSFSVASSKKIKGESITTWVRCSMWGQRGVNLSQYLTKGTKVAVSGEVSTREYDGKTYLELRVSEIDLMGGGQDRQQTRAPASDNNGHDAGQGDDGLPF